MPDRRNRAGFITRNLQLLPVPGLPEIVLYTAQSRSGLSRLDGPAPYWAYVWAGGAALARHVLDSGVARGRRVLDFGAGSGVVGIAAAMAGAARVCAVDPDPWAQAAVVLNAAANAVQVGLEAGEPDLVLCGDVFYDPAAAARVEPVLDGFRARGIRVLVGDPGRADLPLARLFLLAEYQVHDMGDGPGKTARTGIYDYRPTPTTDGHRDVRQSDA